MASLTHSLMLLLESPNAAGQIHTASTSFHRPRPLCRGYQATAAPVPWFAPLPAFIAPPPRLLSSRPLRRSSLELDLALLLRTRPLRRPFSIERARCEPFVMLVEQDPSKLSVWFSVLRPIHHDINHCLRYAPILM